MKSVYELKYFKNSTEPELIKALSLYSQNIEPALRTDSKEIMFWIDRYNKKFEDSFFILGLYLNSVLIGFAELAYFIKEKIIIIDYLVIDKQFRKNNTFYEFAQKIEDFINDRDIVFNYAVVEVGFYNEKLEPPEKSKHMIRLLKMSGFSVAKCEYYTPKLGLYNYESEMKSILMVYSRDGTKKIKVETFMQIVYAIYFKYNQRWYDAFLNDDEKFEYQKGLNKLITKVEKGITNKEFIELNGYGNILTPHGEKKDVFERHKFLKFLTGIFLIVLSFVIVISIYLFLKNKLGIEASALSSLLYATLLVLIFLSAILFERKSNLFSKIIEKIFDLWD